MTTEAAARDESDPVQVRLKFRVAPSRLRCGFRDDVPPLLVVDDEFLVRLGMADALREGGYTVLEAEDGRSALAEIEQLDDYAP